MATREVEIQADDGVQLAGTLTTPGTDGLAPAALLLNGSGPLDRDANMPGQALNVGSALAAGLAGHGVGSLRFDKRGVGESAGDYLRAGFDEETRDAGAVLDALRRVDGIDGGRVAVIGHSVGATVAVRLASSSPPVAGVVLLCVSIRPGVDVMRWQSERIAASLRWPSRLLRGRVVRRQERVRRLLLGSTDDVVRVGRTELPARWFREYMTYDPQPDLRALDCPVLAITGRKDVQVDPDDVARIGAIVGSSFTGETPEALTHVLRRHDGPPGLGTYRAQLEGPVDPALVERVSAWTAAVSKGRAL